MTPIPAPESDSVADLQRALQAARDELQAFTYTVSHDLRAPLRHINAFAQIIEEDWLTMPPEVAGHLATIRQSAQLLTRQLDGLTALSRLAQAPLHMALLNASALVADGVTALSQGHGSRQIDWQLAPGLPEIWADEAMLQQVLGHVLDNAAKFTRPRNPARIQIGGDRLPAGGAVLTIADNGVGFKPGQADQLFKVFARLHPAREFDGLGLGLVMSHKLMARMGGGIQITAEPDRGCTVRLRLMAPPMGAQHSESSAAGRIL
ncbi:MAG: two-component sensor histidine kinase [Rhodoferax sp.]|jgi:two-component system OmpR family sensor kinase|uniref:sensor histidine kinase n=1 Tax=Rhodoferax sp. TaxID=50421 RepID=UPI001B4EAE8C|nr:ATP-binding protein [Rhodoferax sp.]MBP9736881.1 two-component sensor histidine kinase [Rhodoferax sp.]